MVAPYLARPAGDGTYPLNKMSTTPLRVVDHDPVPHPWRQPPNRVSTPPTSELSVELDGATAWLNVPADEILLAALGRTIARTIGAGVATVDVADRRGSVLHAVPLICATGRQTSSTEMLRGVHHALNAGPHAADTPTEILFNDVGEVPDATISIREVRPEYALELRVYRTAGLLHLDWWYDTDRFEPYTVAELSEQLPLAIIEMTSDALAPC